MTKATTLTDDHNLFNEVKFRIKSGLLILRRSLQNIVAPHRRFTDNGAYRSFPIIAVSESVLWNIDDNEQNWILTAGKVHNLRTAAKRLHGVEVLAGETFSFWRHMGNPNVGKGYVVGREIREGCIVPTIAGGLCQLSNALYDAALKANFEIVERHRHSKVIKGSLAEQDRDATVKWNYVDLRFKSNHAFRIEIDVTSDKLVVKFRSQQKNSATANSIANVQLPSSKLNDCYSCGNLECFKHPDRTSVKTENAITTYILDEKWSEYDRYIHSISTDKDVMIVPLRKNKFVNTRRYNWSINDKQKVLSVPLAAMQRALRLRVAMKTNRNAFSVLLQCDDKMAKAAAILIPIESTHLVVSQNLLPFLLEQGVLGGRTFDVLMNRLPFERLHERLDLAHRHFPESTTLNDFRAEQHLIDLENIALTRARHIITPHQEIADMFAHKALQLPWIWPSNDSKKEVGKKILFPASAYGRKGAYEVRRLAMELEVPVVLLGRSAEDANFWNGVTTEFVEADPLAGVGLVVYPAYVEHQPRLLLKALAAGIPVITTTACGLPPAKNLTIVSFGDYAALKHAVEKWLMLNLTKGSC